MSLACAEPPSEGEEAPVAATTATTTNKATSPAPSIPSGSRRRRLTRAAPCRQPANTSLRIPITAADRR